MYASLTLKEKTKCELLGIISLKKQFTAVRCEAIIITMRIYHTILYYTILYYTILYNTHVAGSRPAKR